jgi:hypothetical protein
MIRSAVLLLLLSGIAWWLHGEHTRGRFQQVDEVFLDFLLANSRDDLRPDPALRGGVIHIAMNEADHAEFSTWPPAPIDYQLLLKALAPAEPRVLAIAEPLIWPAPKPDFIDALNDALLLPASVVLATANADHLPPLPRVQGEPQRLPTAATDAPAPDVKTAGERGLIDTARPRIAFRRGEQTLPSFELQTITAACQVPYASQRLVVGAGAGVHLGAGRFVPLEPDGSFAKAQPVTTISALDLLNAQLGDDDAELRTKLGKGKVLILGRGDELTAQRAAAIATALALPAIQSVPPTVQYGLWVFVAALGMALLFQPKHKAITRTALLLFAALASSYFLFQSTKLWCPPMIPTALIAASGLFARLFGKPSA